jgi:hypothetical protein
MYIYCDIKKDSQGGESMNYSVPSYLTPFILTGSVAAIATLIVGLRRALSRTSWQEKQRTKAFWGMSAILAAWFVFAVTTSLASWWGGPGHRIPTIQFGLFVPIVIGVLLFWTWPLLRRTVAAVPNEWLVGLQFYRALGIIFLILYAAGRLPGLFALPAGIGDVAVGLLAPSVAAAYARSAPGAARRVRLWNALGIADLTIAVTLGFLTSPSPLQLAAFDRPSTLIAVFPLSLIPVYMVPLSILLHFASLHRLREANARKAVAGSGFKQSFVQTSR